MHFKNILPAALVAITLGACAGQSEPRLEGKRIDILSVRDVLVPDISVYSERMLLPKASLNESWSQVGMNSSHEIGHLNLPEKVRVAWKKDIGAGSGDSEVLLNPPVVHEDLLYAVNTSGKVYALSAEKGRVAWKTKLELKEEDLEDFSAGLAVQNSRVYVATGTGEVIALGTTGGEELWRADIGVPIRSAPAVSDGRVFVVGHNNSLYVLNQQDGQLLWTHNGIEESLALMGGAPPAVADGVVVVPYSSGEIYALNAETGQYLWHDALSVNVGLDPYASLVDVQSSPVIAGGAVYAVNHSGRLSAFDLKTGRRFWSREVSATQMPWIVGNALFVVTDAGQLVAVHRQDGRIRWIEDLNERLDEDEQEKGAVWVGPVMAGGRLIIASNIGYAIAMDPFKGRVLKVVELPDGVTLAPLVANETLYFMTEDAKVIAFR